MKVKPNSVSNCRLGKGKGKTSPHLQNTDNKANPSLLRNLLQGDSSSNALLSADTADELLDLLPVKESGAKQCINISRGAGCLPKEDDSSSSDSESNTSEDSVSEEQGHSKKVAPVLTDKTSAALSGSVVYVNDCLPYVPTYEPISPAFSTPTESESFYHFLSFVMRFFRQHFRQLQLHCPAPFGALRPR